MLTLAMMIVDVARARICVLWRFSHRHTETNYSCTVVCAAGFWGVRDIKNGLLMSKVYLIRK